MTAGEPMSQPDETQATNYGPHFSCTRRTFRRRERNHFFYAALVALLCVTLAAQLRADTISGTVKDPSGAVVAGARVEITGGSLTQPIVLVSDESGRFVAPNLNPGKYSVRVAKDGFDSLVTTVDLKGAVDLPLSLTITA